MCNRLHIQLRVEYLSPRLWIVPPDVEPVGALGPLPDLGVDSGVPGLEDDQALEL